MSAEPALRLHDADHAEPPTNAPTLTALVAGLHDSIAPRLLKLEALFKMLDVSRSTGHRLLAAGKIGPRPIRLTTAVIRFDAEECSAWLSMRKADGNLHDSRTWPAVWSAKRR